MRGRERRYAVWLHERRVGTLTAHDDHTVFVLDDGYVRDPQRAFLGLRFEDDLGAQHRSNVRLPPWFSNLLPEGRLRQWVADQRGVSEAREMELLAELGHDLPGAVRVTEDLGSSVPAVAARREVVTDGPQSSPRENIWRFSLAGVALKFSMLQRDDRFTAPGVGEGGDWIIKLPDRLFPDVPLNEFAMMELARLAGLDVPEIRLLDRQLLDDLPQGFWPAGETRAYGIRRFDRTQDRSRVHIEDLAQVRGFYPDPDSKYRGSFETVGALVYRGHDTRSLVEFARRLAFNILIGNGDAHLKNWSLLYQNPRVPILAPAYDLVATAVYRSHLDPPEDLGLTFGGSRRFEVVSLATFARLQRKLNAQGIDLPAEVRDLVERVASAWPQVADLLKDQPFLRDGIGSGIEARARSLLRR